ncbi:unnamed protein product [Urochloa humidicola]
MPASIPCFDFGRSGITRGFDSGVQFIGLIAAVPTRWVFAEEMPTHDLAEDFTNPTSSSPCFPQWRLARPLLDQLMTICGAEGGAAGNDLDADPSHSIASRSSSAAPQSLGTIIARCQTICLFLKSFASGEVHT